MINAEFHARRCGNLGRWRVLNRIGEGGALDNHTRNARGRRKCVRAANGICGIETGLTRDVAPLTLAAHKSFRSVSITTAPFGLKLAQRHCNRFAAVIAHFYDSGLRAEASMPGVTLNGALALLAPIWAMKRCGPCGVFRGTVANT